MKKILLIVSMALVIVSCNYLDVVPEGRASQNDIFKTPQQAETFVYSLYQFMPNLSYKYAPGLFGGDDIISSPPGGTRYFQYKSLIYSNDGESPSNTYFAMWGNKTATGGTSYDLFKGVRYCYILLNNIDKVPGMQPDRIRRAKGNALFCIAYYHMTSLLFYGPTMIVDRELSLNSETATVAKRQPYDACVDFIAKTFDDAAALLEPKLGSDEVGMATSVAAKAFKARLLLYAASPLVNGNSEFYADFKNKDGERLMTLASAPEKWERARKAAEEAILLAEQSGYSLYEEDSAAGLSDAERGRINYRSCFLPGEKWNEREYLFAKGDQGGLEGLQKYSGPRTVKNNKNGFCPTFVPTFSAVELYYTKNGLPLDKDPLTKDLNLYEADPAAHTARLHLNREPRFYASIGYDRGTYEVNNTTLTINARAGELAGSTRNPADEYQSCTGYYMLKWIGSGTVFNPSGNKWTYMKFAYPYIRLAELYLSYAEADFEYNGKLGGVSLGYLNKVRHRAGLPGFEASWALAGGIPTGEELRQVIRQERSIELLFEGMRYHDLRRWKTAHVEYRKFQKAWNLDASAESEFYKITEMKESGTRNFTAPKSYWLAIPIKEMQNNPNLVQNPGY